MNGELIILFDGDPTIEEMRRFIKEQGLTVLDIMKEAMENEGVPRDPNPN